MLIALINGKQTNGIIKIDSFSECYLLVLGCQMISNSSRLPDDMPMFSHYLVPIGSIISDLVLRYQFLSHLADKCLIGFLDPRCLLFPSFGPAFRTWTRATSSSGMSRSKSPIEQSTFSSRFDVEMKKFSMPSSTVTLDWRCDVICVTSSLSSKDPVSPPAGGGLPWNRRGLGVFLIRSETNYFYKYTFTIWIPNTWIPD